MNSGASTPISASSRKPRIVVVTRKSLYQLLVERHGTSGQAEFYLRSRNERIEPYIEMHERAQAALGVLSASIAADQRRTSVDRDDLDRFLFAPDDVIVIVGQDGLVPNVAKYLNGQPVIGVNPDPDRYDGVLCRHRVASIGSVLRWCIEPGGEFAFEPRVMAEALREDGQRLLALNEVFVGHRTHQSARYRLEVGSKQERQSSSGVICSTGTGATGWARSIVEQRDIRNPLPPPGSPNLAWFVREPFPSVSTSTQLSFGTLGGGETLRLISEMSDSGVLFADGIESDRLEFISGQTVEIRVAEERLNLVVPRGTVSPQSVPQRAEGRAKRTSRQ